MSVEDDMHQEREYRLMMQSYEHEAMKLRMKFQPDKSGRYDLSDPVLKKAIKKAASKAAKGTARNLKEAALWAVFGAKKR